MGNNARGYIVWGQNVRGQNIQGQNVRGRNVWKGIVPVPDSGPSLTTEVGDVRQYATFGLNFLLISDTRVRRC